MFTRQLALVPEEASVTMNELTAVAAALQKQVTRDFAPLWKVEATIDAFGSLEEVPLDYWPVIVKDDIGDPDAAGYHDDDHGQPFSLVQFEKGWSLTASHEVLEMLGDPFGRRLIAGQSPNPKQGRVRFLVEVCDPSEAYAYSYTVNGVRVSDFYTPHYFDPVRTTGVRYSFTDSIHQPLEVLKGGYLSWYDSATRTWWQRTWFGGSKPADAKLAKLKIKNGNLRQALDRVTAEDRAKAMRAPAKAGPALLAAPAAAGAPEFENRATDLRKAVKSAMKKK